MNETYNLIEFCVSTPLLGVSFTSEEWTMIAFVCMIVFIFTGKRLLTDIKGWMK